MANAPTLFFDIGGVLLTNGWDTAARTRAVEHFEIDPHEFQTRHEMLVTALETGRIDLDTYLRKAVFHRPRTFTAADFRAFMFAQSQLLDGGETLKWAGALAATGRYHLYTLSNESREVHEYRAKTFGLPTAFRGQLISCFLGQLKPHEEIYLNALGIAGCHADDAVFIDDRALNVEPAETLGLHAVQFQGLDALRAFLKDRGIEG